MVDFGYDLSGISDEDPAQLEVGGTTVLAQAVARRLITPRGRLVDDPNYGFDLTGFVNDDIGPGDIARIQSGIIAECLKDERIQSAACTVTLTTKGVMTIVLTLSTAAGPFKLVLAVTDVTATLLSVS